MEYARRHQLGGIEYGSLYRLWRLAWRHGDWSWAFDRLPLVLRLTEGTGPLEVAIPRFAVGAASCALDLGRPERAAAVLERHRERLDRITRPDDHLPYLEVSLRTAGWVGHHDEADRAATSIVEAAEPSRAIDNDGIRAVLVAARHLASRPHPDADAMVAACLEALSRLERQYGSAEAKASLEEGRALEAAAGGAKEETATLWARAADLWRAASFPLREARALAAATRVLRLAGHHAEGKASHERAEALLATLTEQIPTKDRRESFARDARGMLAPDGQAPA